MPSKVADKTVDDIDVANIDTADGEKIVKNVFGDNEEQVVNQLGGLGGGSSLFKSLLPMLAPIVMGYLGKQLAGGGGGASAALPDAAARAEARVASATCSAACSAAAKAAASATCSAASSAAARVVEAWATSSADSSAVASAEDSSPRGLIAGQGRRG